MSGVEDVEAGQGLKWQDHSNDSTPMNSSPNPSLREKSDDNKILSFDDHDNLKPCNWNETRKWFLCSIALAGTLLLPLNGTSITIAARQVGSEFHVSDTKHFTNTYWMVTSWSVGGGIFIQLFLSLVEELGVTKVYFSFYALFVLILIPQALAQNFATLVVTRFFGGGCVALLANTIATILGDLWPSKERRSLPTGVYILFFIAGSILGPVLYAPVLQYGLNWKWIFYIQLIMYVPLGLFQLTFLRETRGEARGQTLLTQVARRFRKQTGRNIYTKSEHKAEQLPRILLDAMKRSTHLLFTEPVLFAATLWSAFAIGLVYVFTQSVEQVFTGLYGWESWRCGYVQASVVLGAVLGWLASFFGTYLFSRSKKSNTEFPDEPIPEARLYLSIFASFGGIAGGMFVYGWTSYSSFPWWAPSIGLVMVGFGVQIVVSAIADYVIDAYTDDGIKNYAASAISAVAFGENIVAGFVPLASQSMYTNLGFQWASSLLGFLALLLSFVPVVFVFYGRTLRERSPFMQSAERGGSRAT